MKVYLVNIAGAGGSVTDIQVFKKKDDAIKQSRMIAKKEGGDSDSWGEAWEWPISAEAIPGGSFQWDGSDSEGFSWVTERKVHDAAK